jgi:protein-disulfide isomerase
VLVGLAIVVFASGVLSPKAPPTELLSPLSPTPLALVDPTNSRALGSANAPVTIDIWSDFQCPACDSFEKTVEPDLITAYVSTGKARFVYHDFAFIDQGAPDGESQQAAAAARCAGPLFWSFHDYLFENQGGENQGTFSPDFLSRIATAVGVNRATYDACMANGAADTVAAVKAETAAGTAAGVNQTPTIMLNGKPVSQNDVTSISTLGPLIDALVPASPSPSVSPTASPGASASPTASSGASSLPGASPGTSSPPTPSASPESSPIVSPAPSSPASPSASPGA